MACATTASSHDCASTLLITADEGLLSAADSEVRLSAAYRSAGLLMDEGNAADAVKHLETVIREECGNNTGGTKTLKIFADQIAPEKDFAFSNSLNPNSLCRAMATSS